MVIKSLSLALNKESAEECNCHSFSIYNFGIVYKCYNEISMCNSATYKLCMTLCS